jgi:general secretion pathway protein I
MGQPCEETAAVRAAAQFAATGHRVRGFSLLEVLVAFLIVGLALAALTSAARTGTLFTRVSAHTREAVSRARSHLDTSGRDIHLGEQSGDDGGGFTWRTGTVPAATSPPADGRGVPLVLYHIWADISWGMDGGRRHVRLDTLRLGAIRPAP